MIRFALLLIVLAGCSGGTVEVPTATPVAERLVDQAFENVAQGHQGDAIKNLDDALEFKPDHAEALALRGNLYSGQRRHAEAIADLNHALVIDPSIVSVWNDLAWLLATSSEDSLRDGKRALQLIETAIAKGADDWQFRDTHAAALAECGRFTEARQVAEAAMESAPKEQMDGLESRLFSYQQGKPWRE